MMEYIHWNPDPVALQLFGLSIRWYSLFWAMALLSGYAYMSYLYKKQRIPEEIFTPLFLYCFLGVLIGARLGHCLFYEPAYYLTHIAEMLLPVRKFQDGWHIVGYEGLASHGGVLGLLVALWMYAKKTGMNLLRVLDNMGIITPMSAAFIRLGNLMNSEIVGLPTQQPWGVIFVANGEDFPRHPAMVYESIFYFLVLIAIAIVYHYKDNYKKVGSGFYFGFTLFAIFAFRFVIEFLKADQVASEADMMINIGQWLSIPLALLGLYCLMGGSYVKKYAEKSDVPMYKKPVQSRKK